MKVKFSSVDHKFMISITESLDLYSAPELKEAFVTGNREGCVDYTVDLAQVNEMDSSAIGALLFGAGVAKKAGGSLSCININEQLRKVFTIGKFQDIFAF